ncbi:hypothetical protein [Gaoshiqia sp. Z1-71]|uniref:hypothetical protein n=1 Tax=Gaoshiqia hydrogeniformans TaxID=3290090 RepID=UPI003BF78966
MFQLPGSELNSYEHHEENIPEGYTLKYRTQEDDEATKSDYTPLLSVATHNDLPAVVAELYDEVVHVDNTGYDYILKETGSGREWKQIGRLKEYTEGTAAENLEINANVPVCEQREISQISKTTDITIVNTFILKNEPFTNQSLYITLFRGSLTLGSVTIPNILSNRQMTDGSRDFDIDLTPSFLNTYNYALFMEWKAYHARRFVKYFKMSLKDVVNLKFKKRYVINGIPFILNKINFELSHKGIVKIEGYTAPNTTRELPPDWELPDPPFIIS